MSKSVKTLIAAAAILAVAAPAMAEFKFSGEFRAQGYHQTAQDKESNDARSLNVIDQRFRPKLDYKINDYISLTYFAEIDTLWGEQSGAATGQGGRVGADGVNVETKNVYVDFKLPQTASKLRLGVQGFKDSFDGVVVFDDMAAANLSGKLGPLDYQVIYSKWDEGIGRDNTPRGSSAAAIANDRRVRWNDVDFYGADLSHKYGDFAKAGLAVYYYDNNSGNAMPAFPQAGIGANSLGEGPNVDAEIWWMGLYGDYRFGNFALNGWALYQTGEVLQTAATNTYVDTRTWAASVKGRMVIPNGDLGLRYMYFAPDDSATDLERFFISQGNYEFADENLMIFLVDKFVNNVPKNRYAITDAVEAGYGLHGLVASANLKNLPMGTYSNLGAGAFFAADKNPDGAARKDKGTLGYEVAASVGKVFAEKFDLSLRGSYAFLGKFYNTTANNNDPDDLYTVALMARVPF
ncbi:hypothetical protein [Geoalkalibacter sp.]|uniref:hypothetical protein n=1 Tax=Geoalkalibacter sp. TaxID=3041440 RepID=UPI00272DD84B|nr:hypothetical protein [Geoalkalibacter sp.]